MDDFQNENFCNYEYKLDPAIKKTAISLFSGSMLAICRLKWRNAEFPPKLPKVLRKILAP